MNNSYITIIKEKRTALSRKRIPLNQNGCTANFRIGVPFEQNLHIMYLKSVHAHSLAIFLASQLFLSHNTFHCPSLHIKLKAILFILNQNQHDYIISSESAFFQQNNAPAIKPERYILSISNYLKLFLCHRLFLYNLSVSKISFFES